MKTEKRNARRQRVIVRLEEQLARGVKTTKDGEADLTKADISRIEKELNTLRDRVDKFLPR